MGTEIVDVDFHYLMSLFKNNDSFRVINIVDDMTLVEFQAQYGEQTLPVIGVTATSALIPAKGTEQFNKGDRWIVMDKQLA